LVPLVPGSNNLNGSIPMEVVLLSDSLCKWRDECDQKTCMLATGQLTYFSVCVLPSRSSCIWHSQKCDKRDHPDGVWPTHESWCVIVCILSLIQIWHLPYKCIFFPCILFASWHATHRDNPVAAQKILELQ
jgi:hypothetical protein